MYIPLTVLHMFRIVLCVRISSNIKTFDFISADHFIHSLYLYNRPFYRHGGHIE